MDHLEFYPLNYFKPGLGKQDSTTEHERAVFHQIGCNSCHMSDLRINHDRRVADVQTVYDPVNGNFNILLATATPLVKIIYDGSGHPPLKRPKGDPFLAENIFTVTWGQTSETMTAPSRGSS